MVLKAAEMRRLALSDAFGSTAAEFWPALQAVLGAARHPGEHEHEARIRAAYDYALRNFDFSPAPAPLGQLVLRPAALQARRVGDCLAMATWVACYGISLAYHASLIFVSANREGTIEHVWTRLFYPARARQFQIDVDPTYRRPDAHFGWSVPESVRTRVIEVTVC